ncbi:MAG: hypothetical protein ABJF10_05180 [Chthoniobacter sp.]|uniref:hypothetical protein n=1 Tax=Chthoniobacter sp. TaxID=2510640 RepID=UPI0032A3A720
MPHARKRKLHARIWLGVVFLLLTGAHYFLYRFSVDRLNNYPISQGLMAGSVLWTTVLLGAMWLRYAWSRYIMIATICVAMIGFSVVALLVRSESVNALPHLMRYVAGGLLFYAFALIPLSATSSLRHYLGPRTAGER